MSDTTPQPETAPRLDEIITTMLDDPAFARAYVNALQQTIDAQRAEIDELRALLYERTFAR